MSAGPAARAALVLAAAALLVGCASGPAAPARGSASAYAGSPSEPATSMSTSTGSRSPTAPAPAGSASPTAPMPAVPDVGWRGHPDRVASDQELSAYADRTSVAPGERVTLFVRSIGPFAVTAFRIGAYGSAGAARVWRGRLVPATAQPDPTTDATTRAVVARWRATTSLDTTGWAPGLYALRLDLADGRHRFVPLVVRSPRLVGAVVLVASVTTWAAYNAWGGRSLYHGPSGRFHDRSYAVSFDRPYDGDGFGLPSSFDAPVAQQAERMGVPLAYTTNLDLDAAPQAVDGALGLVSDGHDEYWTSGYRSALLRARDAGIDLAFLGANAGYWRVRLEPSPLGPRRLVVGYKSAAQDPVHGEPNTTARWRDAPHSQPEETVVGQRYDCYPAHGDLVVRDPAFFLFAGTGAVTGSTFRGLIGIESDRAYPLATTPRPLQVPALSPTRCGAGAHTWSTMTYATFPSGAGVLAVGTMNWVRALRGVSATYRIGASGVRFARQVTTNLLHAMAAGMMGRNHPARDDLDRLGLPTYNTTGSA